MKHLLVFLASTVFCTVAFADKPLPVAWNQLCQISEGQELNIITTSGESISGYCVRVDVNALSLSKTMDRDPRRLVPVARAAVAKVLIRPAKQNQLKALGHAMHDALRDEGKWLFSPAAPLALVALPSTLAWGAVAAPFCMMGDLDNLVSHSAAPKEIHII